MKYCAYIQYDGKEWGSEIIDVESGDTASKAVSRLTTRFRKEYGGNLFADEQEFVSGLHGKFLIGLRPA